MSRPTAQSGQAETYVPRAIDTWRSGEYCMNVQYLPEGSKWTRLPVSTRWKVDESGEARKAEEERPERRKRQAAGRKRRRASARTFRARSSSPPTSRSAAAAPARCPARAPAVHALQLTDRGGLCLLGARLRPLGGAAPSARSRRGGGAGLPGHARQRAPGRGGHASPGAGRAAVPLPRGARRRHAVAARARPPGGEEAHSGRAHARRGAGACWRAWARASPACSAACSTAPACA